METKKARESIHEIVEEKIRPKNENQQLSLNRFERP